MQNSVVGLTFVEESQCLLGSDQRSFKVAALHLRQRRKKAQIGRIG